MLTHYIKTFFNNHPALAQSTMLVGFSGGPDSVALLHALCALRQEFTLTIIAAHFNHEWRDVADNDEEWCRAFAQALGVEFYSACRSEYAHRVVYNGSQEAYGRVLRRTFFNDVVQKYTASYVALAHHADDQQENFFIRLLRGTSLTGLVGMKPLDGVYVRPLLGVHKKDLYAYLTAHNLTYCIDETNTSDAYLRNRVRNNVIPALRDADARYDQNMMQLLARLADTERYLETLTTQHYNAIVVSSKHYLTPGLNLAALGAHDRYMQYRIILHWCATVGFPLLPAQSLLDEMLRFMLTSPRAKRHSVASGWHLEKANGAVFMITSVK